MEVKINFIDLNEKLDHRGIYNLFKTNSSKINKEIIKKILIFKQNMDFFEFYSDGDIKKLLNIFRLVIPKYDDELFSAFKSDTEQYISCISQIILSIKLFLKTQDILTKVIANAKNHLAKLKYEKRIKNSNQDSLFSYLDSLFKISEKTSKFNSRNSTVISSNISSFEYTPKNFLFRNFSTDYRTTPRFQLELESDEKLENQENKNSNSGNLIKSNTVVKKGSILSLSDYVFDEESDNIITEPSIVKPKIKKSFSRNGSANKTINKKFSSSPSNVIVKKNNSNYYKNLLEMINIIYKKGLVNSEEKVKLKQLVIERSKKLEYLYYNIYKNSKRDKNTLLIAVKKLLN